MHLASFCFILFFLQIEGLCTLALSDSVGAIFQTACAHLVFLCHNLVIPTIFQTFSLLFYLLW